MQDALAASGWELVDPPPAAGAAAAPPGPHLGAQTLSAAQPAAAVPALDSGAAVSRAASSTLAATAPLLPSASGSLGADDEDEAEEAGVKFYYVYPYSSAANPWYTMFMYAGKLVPFGCYADQVDAAIGADAARLWLGLHHSQPQTAGGDSVLSGGLHY